MGATGKLRIIEGGYAAYCPGCQCYHLFDSRWTFDGNFESPTFNPSLVVLPSTDKTCHSFVKNGHWEYLPDSFHDLKGQTVPMEDED